MSAKASQRTPKTTHAADGRGSGSHRVRSRRSGSEVPADDERSLSPPLPSDPAILAEIHAGIERGLADARAGIGEDWEVAHARIFGHQPG